MYLKCKCLPAPQALWIKGPLSERKFVCSNLGLIILKMLKIVLVAILFGALSFLTKVHLDLINVFLHKNNADKYRILHEGPFQMKFMKRAFSEFND